MAKRDEQHDREARTRFNDRAQRSMRTSQKVADVARKTANDAAFDLKTRKDYRRKRAASKERA